jgi:hypothetical protein
VPLASAVIAIALLALLIIASNSRLDFLNRIRHPFILFSLLAILIFLSLFLVDRYYWRFIPQTSLLNVSLGDELPIAIEKIGTPVREEGSFYYFDNGISLGEENNRVKIIGLYQPTYLSLSGIRIDMPLVKVQTLLGKPDQVEGTTHFYQHINLRVTFEDDEVSHLEITSPPN